MVSEACAHDKPRHSAEGKQQQRAHRWQPRRHHKRLDRPRRLDKVTILQQIARDAQVQISVVRLQIQAAVHTQIVVRDAAGSAHEGQDGAEHIIFSGRTLFHPIDRGALELRCIPFFQHKDLRQRNCRVFIITEVVERCTRRLAGAQTFYHYLVNLY